MEEKRRIDFIVISFSGFEQSDNWLPNYVFVSKWRNNICEMHKLICKQHNMLCKQNWFKKQWISYFSIFWFLPIKKYRIAPMIHDNKITRTQMSLLFPVNSFFKISTNAIIGTINKRGIIIKNIPNSCGPMKPKISMCLFFLYLLSKLGLPYNLL